MALVKWQFLESFNSGGNGINTKLNMLRLTYSKFKEFCFSV